MNKGDICLYTEQFDSDLSEIPNTGAAIVTRVHDNDVLDLTVFYLNGSFVKMNVPKGDVGARGTWHPKDV